MSNSDTAAVDRDDETQTLRLVNFILTSASEKRASDIHIEPNEKELRVSYRIDGIVYDVVLIPIQFRDAVISCVKRLAGLDVDEQWLPQEDGHLTLAFHERGVCREMLASVSSTPTRFGEKVLILLEGPGDRGAIQS